MERLPVQVAQLLHLRRQIPPLYALLAVNASALAFTHRHLAPSWLTIGVAGVLVLACVARLIAWTLPIRPERMTPEHASAQMRRTTRLAVVLAVGFVAWALRLDQYGGPYEHGHVAMFIAVTVLGCVFCLTYLPRAAELVCVLVIGTFLVYCLIKGTEVLVAVAVNIALVSAVIIKVLNDSFASFLKLEESQAALTRERQQAHRLSEQNKVLAHTDALTGLPNRRLFFSELDRLLAEEGPGLTVGVVDLDRFKPINDIYGHTQGDRLLQAIGERLRTLVSPGVMIARLGGDEFGLLVSSGSNDVAGIAEAVCGAINDPIRAGDTRLSVGCSLGLATFPEGGRTAHDLFDHADAALYHAKEKRRGGWVSYTRELDQVLQTGKLVDAALQTADLAQELSVVFQPIFEARTLETVGYEALARWHSPRIGLVPADVLIAAAERTGMMNRLTLELFDKALAVLGSLPPGKRINFNLSALDLVSAPTVEALLRKIEQAGVDPSKVVFELTESSLIPDMEAASRSLRRLRAGGCLLALDDFGTGYSSLSSLHQLPFQYVKIDRSFTARLSDKEGRKLIGAIRGLAQSLSLQCVLEGIEVEAHLLEAGLIGIDFVQGYYLSRPRAWQDIVDDTPQLAAG